MWSWTSRRVAVMVRGGDRAGDRGVLLGADGQSFEAARLGRPEPVEPAPLLGCDIREQGVIGSLLQDLVEHTVAFRPRSRSSFGRGLLHHVDTLAQCHTLFLGQVLRCSNEHRGVDEAEHIAHLPDIGRGEPGDRVPAVVISTHQLVQLQPLQSRPHRCSTDSEPLRQRHLPEVVTRARRCRS